MRWGRRRLKSDDDDCTDDKNITNSSLPVYKLLRYSLRKREARLLRWLPIIKEVNVRLQRLMSTGVLEENTFTTLCFSSMKMRATGEHKSANCNWWVLICVLMCWCICLICLRFAKTCGLQV
jgi:hypothetical protein